MTFYNLKCPPLRSGHLQRKNILIFAKPENLRIFRFAFHRKGRTGHQHLLLSACRPSRSDSKSAEAENTVKKSSRRTGVNLQYFRLEPSSLGLSRASSPFFATTTTAACGRNREELLGQWPAGCETRPRVEADTGCHNPQHPARRNRWHFSGFLLVAKENISAYSSSALRIASLMTAYAKPRRCRAATTRSRRPSASFLR